MAAWCLGLRRISYFALLFWLVPSASSLPNPAWSGVLRDSAGKPVAGATIKLRATAGSLEYAAKTSGSGSFVFSDVTSGAYELSVSLVDKTWKSEERLEVKDDGELPRLLELSAQDQTIRLIKTGAPASAQASGGEHLSSGEVSTLPLNERDFSKLLLLAAGTMTDSNGAANFTQQFAVNGQRGTASVFALDGADTTDPELGGATFANFNVDAIQEVQSSSGVMPAEIGHGAAGFTNVISKSGTNLVHGSVFEFVRNAAFDARNYFDHASRSDTRRLPPFVRNEFGATNGGPVVLPGIYDGRGKTYYFGEYQGFRQVLGTTQVFPVPTFAERQGIDTTTFPGDRLTVPVNAAIAPVLAKYPLPNEPNGPYGLRTYAASSKIVTNTDQFTVRIDHRISDNEELLTRFSLNQINGPTTNPDQTAIDPSFGVRFFDHQRNATVKYTSTISPHYSFTIALGYDRSTPFFPTIDHTQPAISYGDGLYQGFNSAGGSVFGSYGNLYQLRHDMSYTRGSHTFKWGAEIRVNRDATIFGTNPNGIYTFGGGTAYSPVFIPSASGQHNINPGDPLPDALTGMLTATPYSYDVIAAAVGTPGGDKFDEASVRREAFNFYFEDAWKATPRLTISYGLRYELNSRIKESKHRTSGAYPVDAGGNPVAFGTLGAKEIFIYNPQPPFAQDWKGFGPRLSIDYGLSKHTTLHAGGAITTLLPNLWQDNFVTGGFPLIFSPVVTAQPGVAVPFQNTAVPLILPDPHTVQGNPLFPNGNSADRPANLQIDLQRYQNDLAGITPGHEIQLFTAGIIARNFRNGYISTYTAGLDQDIGQMKFSAAYVGTAGIHLANAFSPNGFAGADPSFAPYTQFDAAGHATGGFGPELLMNSSSHSSYQSLQMSLSQSNSRTGLSFQASYTFSKSIDDASTPIAGGPANAGVILQTLPQDPRSFEAEKGPSTFDVTHVFALSLIQLLPLEKVGFLSGWNSHVTKGWQILNITTITSGSPFTVYSGIQQTGAGAGGADRPDIVSMPTFSTSGANRADYFGLEANNSSFFYIPINVPGGTGPNHGRYGTLGRDTFRGPGFKDFDFAAAKETSLGRRGKGELGILEFRAEFFNIFNIVNFGLPANTVLGSGFGIISKTAGPSRQIQFSLKFVY